MVSRKMSDVELLSRLDAHPGLRSRFESILSIADAEGGTLKEADAAEGRLIEEVRRLGQETLQVWAEGQVEETTAEAIRTPRVRNEGKKNSSGTVRSAKLRS